MKSEHIKICLLMLYGYIMLTCFEYIANQQSCIGTTCFCLQFGHFQLYL